MEVVLGYAIVLAEDARSLVPEVLDAIDVFAAVLFVHLNKR